MEVWRLHFRQTKNWSRLNSATTDESRLHANWVTCILPAKLREALDSIMANNKLD